MAAVEEQTLNLENCCPRYASLRHLRPRSFMNDVLLTEYGLAATVTRQKSLDIRTFHPHGLLRHHKNDIGASAASKQRLLTPFWPSSRRAVYAPHEAVATPAASAAVGLVALVFP